MLRQIIDALEERSNSISDEKEKDFENEKISLQKDFKEKKAIDILKEKKLLKHKIYKKINAKFLCWKKKLLTLIKKKLQV